MFSVSTTVVLLVFFVFQALRQTPASVSPAVSPTVNLTVSPTVNLTVSPTVNLTVSPTVNLTVSPTVNLAVSPTVSPITTTPPSEKTCAKLGVVINIRWIKDFGNNKSEIFQTLSGIFSSALEKVYSDTEKYTNVKVSEVHFTDKDGKVLAEAILSLVFKGGDEVFIEDVFKNKVATGELDGGLTVINGSAEFEPQGVSWKDWKAKDGECEKKCDGAAGPIFIVRKCEDARCSCKGHKTTKEAKECTTYCPSTGAVSVSSVILVIGIFLSSGFL